MIFNFFSFFISRYFIVPMHITIVLFAFKYNFYFFWVVVGVSLSIFVRFFLQKQCNLYLIPLYRNASKVLICIMHLYTVCFIYTYRYSLYICIYVYTLNKERNLFNGLYNIKNTQTHVQTFFQKCLFKICFVCSNVNK